MSYGLGMPTPRMLAGDQICGLSARNESPTTSYGATITLGNLTNNSSREVADHRGKPPPLEDTRHLPPGPGNGRTHTSSTRPPASFETYAIHRPSGENVGSTLVAGLLRKTVGLPGVRPRTASSSIGRIIKSSWVGPRSSMNETNFPFGCH